MTVDPAITAPVYLPSLVTYPTGHNLRFAYNSYGQVTQVEKWVPTVSGQSTERRIADTHFDYWANYGQPWDDLPWFNLRSEMAEKWMGGAAQFYQYQFANRGGGLNAITDPVGISHRVTTSGLVQTLETIPCCQPAGYPTKTVRLEYTDDGLGYRSNPRLLEQKISSGSIYTPDVRKTRYTYLNANPSGLTPVWLPQLVDTYIGDSIVIYRRTNYSYLSYPDWHIFGLVKDTVVWNQSGYAAAWTVNNYDETGSFTDSGGQTAAFFIDATADGAIQHDNYSYGASLVQRGNLTSVKQWWVANNQIGSQSRLLSRISYDTNGNVRSVTDALGNRQQFTYTDYFSNQPAGVGQTAAYLYTAQDPTGFRAGAQYDYYTGLPVKGFNLRPNSATEEQVMTTSYDFADRPLITYRPDGGYLYYTYWDNFNYLDAVQKHDWINGQDIARSSHQEFDGAGRIERQSNPHPDGTIGKYAGQRFVYDAIGRRSQSSNQIAVYGDWTPTAENPLGWLYTTETFDEFSRPQVITRPDNNTRRYSFTNCGCSGGLTASVTDEKGQKTETVADFLGRLSESREYLANSTVIYSKAAYSYDELDRKTAITVISGAASGQSQTRSFVYDGYGRVQSQTTPEGGTVTYAYYDNDQVQSVTDARGMVATYSYNTRKLVTNVGYNDGGATPGVSYSYDEFGARSQMSDGMGATSYSYNSYRQLQSETRTFTGLPGESYSLSYGYNLVDQLKQVTYTATNFSKQINYARTYASTLASIGTNLLGTDPTNTTNVVSLTGYRAFGAITGATYGNGRTLSMGYSEQRHQLTSMIVQKSDGSDRIVDKSYEYYDTNQANTGRLMKQTDHLDPAYSVTYYYDGVNRLYSAQAGSFDTVKGYDRVYNYDEWGNLRTVSGDSDGTSATQFSYTYNYAVNGTGAPATNRLNDVNGVPYSYDAAGNLTNDGVISYAYDAANRMKTSNGGQSLYYYDGDGHRVRRDFPGVTPLYYIWSSVLGNVAMEVRPQTVVRAYVYMGGSPVALQNWDGTFVWIHKDHLGSTSLLTKTDGSVACKTQFDPYGQQVMLWVNPVGGTSISQGFTGYEKDNPTGLYNAKARMYSYGQARFLQPDPLGVGAADLKKPQSFNRYSYVQNDPVNFTDPTGLKPILDCGFRPLAEGGSIWFCEIKDDPEDDLYPDDQDRKPRPPGQSMWDRALAKAFRRVRDILSEEGPCKDFFGSNALTALDAFQNSSIQFKADNSQGVQPSKTGIKMAFGATTSSDIERGYRAPESVVVYTNGPVFLNPRAPLLGGYGPGTDGAQMVALLHELAHMIITGTNPDGTAKYLIPNDGGNSDQSIANTKTIMENCGKQIQGHIGK